MVAAARRQRICGKPCCLSGSTDSLHSLTLNPLGCLRARTRTPICEVTSQVNASARGACSERRESDSVNRQIQGGGRDPASGRASANDGSSGDRFIGREPMADGLWWRFEQLRRRDHCRDAQSVAQSTQSCPSPPTITGSAATQPAGRTVACTCASAVSTAGPNTSASAHARTGTCSHTSAFAGLCACLPECEGVQQWRRLCRQSHEHRCR